MWLLWGVGEQAVLICPSQSGVNHTKAQKNNALITIIGPEQEFTGVGEEIGSVNLQLLGHM